MSIFRPPGSPFDCRSMLTLSWSANLDRLGSTRVWSAEVASRATTDSRVRVIVVAARPRCRAGTDDDAGPGRDRLRRGFRRSGHLWPLRHDRAVAGLCGVRTEPDSCAWPRFGACRADPRCRVAPVSYTHLTLPTSDLV